MESGTEPIYIADDDPVEKWTEQMSVLDKLKYIAMKTTVEPLLGFYFVAAIMSSFATTNLNLEKACRVNLALNDSTCSAMKSGRNASVGVGMAAMKAEAQAQQMVADVIVWKTILQCIISGVLVVFAGSWSDRNRKRKQGMLVPVVGEFLATASRLLCYYYYYQLPMEYTAIAETVPSALTGGTLTLTLSVFSYISDVTTVKTRTLRIGVANVFTSLGSPVAMILSGILLPRIGIPGVFIVSLVLLIICFTYGMMFIEESDSRIKREATTVILQQKIRPSVASRIKDFFDIRHVKDAVRVTFKTGPHNRRLRIVLIMFMVFIVMGPTQGEISIMYIFTRVRFGWREVEFSWFLTYLIAVNVIGTAISVSLFSQYWRMNDALVGAIACLSKILSGYVYAFGKTEWIFYLAPIIEIMSGTAIVAQRSIITKLVQPNELGQVTAIFGICESLVPVIYGPMYTSVYKATLKSTMPGLCFLIGTLSLTPATLIFMWIYMDHKTQENTISIKITNGKIKKHIDINVDKFETYSNLPTN